MRFCMLLLAALIGGGCGDPFTNRPFEDDALFLAALPTAEQLEVGGPSGGSPSGQAATGEVSERARSATCARTDASCNPDLYRQYTVGVANEVNGFTLEILETLDEIRAHEPTSRTEDSRVWGPWRLREELWGRLEVVREAGDFRYELTLAPARDTAWSLLLEGHFSPGSTADEGNGTLTYDFAVQEAFRPGGHFVAGTLDAVYSTRGDGLELEMEGVDLLEADSAAPTDRSYQYREPGDGSGCFYFQKEDDLIEGEGDPERGLELVTIWSCWDLTGRGRSAEGKAGR